MDTTGTDPLTRIRNRIDALDADIHRLLIERSAIIDELIKIKGTSSPGAAFRPGREADMMRRIVMRHEGRLPLTSVEHIWREIITVFTAMQAPFSVIAGPSDDPLTMRDMVRFYFGFSIRVETAESEEAALDMLASGGNRLAVLAARCDTPWWKLLEGDGSPKIFARFPFLLSPERRNLPPVYVAGPPLQDQTVPDIRLYSLAAQGGALGAAMERLGGSIVLRQGDAALVEMPVASTIDELESEFGNTDGRLDAVEPVGGFAEPIAIFTGDEA
jgi:chorismate mutase-like protein